MAEMVRGKLKLVETPVKLVETPVEVIDLTPPHLPDPPTRDRAHHRRLSDEYSWKNEAPCTTVDPNVFFPNKGDNGNEAKMICRGCPVRATCLDEALERGEAFGIWGGMGSKERRALAKARGLRTMSGD